MKKKLISYGIVMLSFFFLFSTPTKAMVSDEVKQEIESYASELGTSRSEYVTQLGRFRDWSNQYADNLRRVLHRDLADQIADALSNENYDTAFDLIEVALNNGGEVAAANALAGIRNDFLSAMHHFEDYSKRLHTFLDANKEGMLMADLTPIILEANDTYSDMKPIVQSILDIYYDAFYDTAKNKLDRYGDMTVSELDDLFSDLNDDLNVYNALLITVDDKVTDIKQLISDLKLSGLGFEESFTDDVRPYVTKIENMIRDVYDEFVLKQWTELRNEANAIVEDTNKSVSERNQLIIEKIEKYQGIQSHVSSNFVALKSKISVSRILSRVERLESKSMQECNDAIEYLRTLLIVEDYDLVLVDGITSAQAILNRESRYIIIRNELDEATFLSYVRVKDEASGEIRSGSLYNGKVGTKSTVGVYNGNNQEVLYYVILKGDTRTNGIIDVSDITFLIKTVLSHGGMDEIEQVAGDMNNDGNLDISDITATIKKVLSK